MMNPGQKENLANGSKLKNRKLKRVMINVRAKAKNDFMMLVMVRVSFRVDG